MLSLIYLYPNGWISINWSATSARFFDNKAENVWLVILSLLQSIGNPYFSYSEMFVFNKLFSSVNTCLHLSKIYLISNPLSSRYSMFVKKSFERPFSNSKAISLPTKIFTSFLISSREIETVCSSVCFFLRYNVSLSLCLIRTVGISIKSSGVSPLLEAFIVTLLIVSNDEPTTKANSILPWVSSSNLGYLNPFKQSKTSVIFFISPYLKMDDDIVSGNKSKL